MKPKTLTRRGVFGLVAAAVWVVTLPTTATAQADVDGLWDAVVVSNDIEIPFRFEIETNGTDARGFFFEGDRRVGSDSGRFEDGVLTLTYDHLQTTLELTLTGDELAGSYKSLRPNGRERAVRARRFQPATLDTAGVPDVAGTWELRRNADEATAPRDFRTLHLFLRQSGAEVSGAILRVSGDTGTLTGHWQDGTLVLSHFAGERPLLFEASLKDDGTMAVTLNRSDNFLAARSEDARALGIPAPPDPSRYTSVADPSVPFAFSFPDMDGNVVSNTDAQFQDKIVLVSIGGSWCPNCHDEAPFLAELYRDYHDRGLEIVALMFEFDEDIEVVRPMMQAFKDRYDIQYPFLFCGLTDKINEALPQIVNFGAYPTSIYLDRNGLVRSVHAGFASEATGEAHERLKAEHRELIEQLLAEPPTSSSAMAEPE